MRHKMFWYSRIYLCKFE